LTCHIDLLGSPLGANPEELHLIVPFELNPKKWLQMHWIDQYSGKKFRTTRENNLQQSSHRAGKNLWRYFTEYKHHPESKWADEYMETCATDRPRNYSIGDMFESATSLFIGKESNMLEEVDAGLILSTESVYTTYPTKDETLGKSL